MIIPFFLAINQDNFWLTQLVMILVLSFGHSMCYAPQASYFPELFPTHIRCSGIALIWQLGSLIGSGILGLVAVKILQVTGGHYYGLATYVIVLGVISVIGLLMMPETSSGRNTNLLWRQCAAIFIFQVVYSLDIDVIPIIKSLMQIKTYNHTGVTLEQS